jgi:hypothetical protein
MIWKYNNSTNIIWTSFDCGEVEAETKEEAYQKAKKQIEYDLKKANDALAHCDITDGFTIEMNLDKIEITLKK